MYLDDILVFSSTEHEHEKPSEACFPTIEGVHKLQAKLKKCEFGKPRINYLSHIVGSRGGTCGQGQGCCSCQLGTTQRYQGNLVVSGLCQLLQQIHPWFC